MRHAQASRRPCRRHDPERPGREPGPKQPTATDAKQLIDELAKVTDSDTGYSATMSGASFLPLPDVLVAPMAGRADRLAALLKEDPDRLKARTADGFPPHLIATREGHVECVRVLLDAGADVKQVDARREPKERLGDSNNWTALHLAAMSGHANVAELLLDRGADVNAIDSCGNVTPLHYAAWNGNVAVVQLLLARKADRTAKDEQGHTALDLARERKHAGVAKVLEGGR